jgi:hypothetical protein
LSETTGFRSAENLTKWVRYALFAQIIVAVISMISGYFEYSLLSDFQNGVYTSQEMAVADSEASDLRQTLVGSLYLLVFIVSGFLILRWIHRANYNARQLGAKDMTTTPGWSIGYYFIPIWSLWKPYQAMKEIWLASKSPSGWDSSSSTPTLRTWWALWLFSNFLGNYIFRASLHAEEIPELFNLNLASQTSNVLDILLALATLAVVNGIYKMQLISKENAIEHLQ